MRVAKDYNINLFGKNGLDAKVLILLRDDIKRIVDTYQNRPEKIERYARRVSMSEIEKNDFNLNISRYVSTAKPEVKIDLKEVNAKIVEVEKKSAKALAEHNGYLKELGLDTI